MYEMKSKGRPRLLGWANQPVHRFLGGKGLGIQQGMSDGLVCPNQNYCILSKVNTLNRWVRTNRTNQLACISLRASP